MSTLQIRESNDRPAWTQYENTPHNGMGSGLNSFRHKQSSGREELKENYYIRSGGKI